MNDSKKSNRLIDEKSPYLLQHAYNPVAWRPWSDESLRLAREQDRPIFLSIGYSTCHWCHVMAHESFEDEEIAALLNRSFISIKVDREERPDLDRIYMAATQAMTGSGGWPLSVFLLPDGRPFYAGTYFPPQPRYGHPGFSDILAAIERVWQEDRLKISESAEKISEYLKESGRSGQGQDLDPELPEQALEGLQSIYDRTYAGFGSGSKFPQPSILEFLLRYTHKTGSSEVLQMVVETLNAMAAGGIYDHIGGGFHRYAVDRQWRVPHFEKMLYDQAQLASLFLDASLLTGNRAYAGIARETLDYTLRDMRREGGFFSAEDADSENPYNPAEHGEGAFFLWQAQEIEQLLGRDTTLIFNAAYGVEANGNALSDPAQEFNGRNILYRRTGDRELSRQFGRTAEEIRDILQKARQTLLQQRRRRTRPHLDDKVITAWNGLMLSALARGSRILEDRRYLQAAEETADFLLAQLVVDGDLKRRWREGEARFDGGLEDYAFLIQGLLDLYAADHRPARLQQALALSRRQVELFSDPAGGFFESREGDDLIARMKGQYDGAEPSGNSVSALNLLRLSSLTGDEAWRDLAEQAMRATAGTLIHQPSAMPLMLAASLTGLGRGRQVVIAGDPANEDTRQLLRAVNSQYLPDTTVLLADGGENQQYLAGMLPFIGMIERKDGKATASLCEGMACRLQTCDPAELTGILRE